MTHIIIFFVAVILFNPSSDPTLALNDVSKRIISSNTSVAIIVNQAKDKEAPRKCLGMNKLIPSLF